MAWRPCKLVRASTFNVKDRAMRLFKFNNFEFNRGLRPSYRSPQRALLVLFVGGVQAANLPLMLSTRVDWLKIIANQKIFQVRP